MQICHWPGVADLIVGRMARQVDWLLYRIEIEFA
jgi:hypothetical protein